MCGGRAVRFHLELSQVVRREGGRCAGRFYLGQFTGGTKAKWGRKSVVSTWIDSQMVHFTFAGTPWKDCVNDECAMASDKDEGSASHNDEGNASHNDEGSASHTDVGGLGRWVP